MECPRKVASLFLQIKTQIKLDYVTIIFNYVQSRNSHFINTVILVLKQYIYVTKCQKGWLNYQEFIAKLNKTYRIENLNAQLNNKSKICAKKWKPYLIS